MKLAIVLAALLLSGCSTTLLSNRVTCTVDGKQAHYVSLYGPLGIASKVDESDAAVICKRAP